MKLNPTHVQTLYTLDFPKCKEHRDTYLEQQETEKIETEVRDVDRRRITKVYDCLGFWGVIRALQSDINICFSPPLSTPL